MIFKDYINESKRLPLTNKEKSLIGDLGIFKEVYKLDSTQSIYRYNKDITSMAFEGKEDLEELKKLVKIVNKRG